MRFLTDENFDGRILDGIRHKLPAVDVVRAQDTEIYQASDPKVLAWAPQENRSLLTHDLRRMPRFAYERVAANVPMPGVIAIPQDLPVGTATEELLSLIGASDPTEYIDKVVYLPL